jgi:hypothetical protein
MCANGSTSALAAPRCWWAARRAGASISASCSSCRLGLLGVGSRQAVYDLVARRRMLGLTRAGESMVFPALQFDPTSGRPYPVIADVLAAFDAAGLDPYTAATWLATGQDELAGGEPRSLLAEPSAAPTIADAARRTAARLSH